ncbi:hypothetical protein [Accumulibacter sp.]|uniref:hypothetical protein n=1 Tax=Accumulibacter sp. TaxID=2053492 RepID=UPI001A4A446F|nr:hypothetical protein [Accumulibacter sp.]MBL8400317.1 hypothetical protein [Accumulibacter sp.]
MFIAQRCEHPETFVGGFHCGWSEGHVVGQGEVQSVGCMGLCLISIGLVLDQHRRNVLGQLCFAVGQPRIGRPFAEARDDLVGVGKQRLAVGRERLFIECPGPCHQTAGAGMNIQDTFTDLESKLQVLDAGIEQLIDRLLLYVERLGSRRRSRLA